MVNNMNIKKIFSALILISLFGITFFAQAATTEGVLSGCTITEAGAKLADCPTDCQFENNPKCGICCILQTLYSVTNWIFVILVGVASLFVILGAMNLLMSGGSTEKVSSGRQYIMFAAIGLVVGLLAKAIPAIVRFVVQ